MHGAPSWSVDGGTALGPAPNDIAIECVDGPGGVTLRMFVNGIAVDEVVDGDGPIPAGTIGVQAQSQRDPSEVEFDDLALVTRRPEPSRRAADQRRRAGRAGSSGSLGHV